MLMRLVSGLLYEEALVESLRPSAADLRPISGASSRLQTEVTDDEWPRKGL